MALLRNCIRLWGRSVRPFSIDLHGNMDLGIAFKEGRHLPPRVKLLNSDFTLNNRLKANEYISHEDWKSIRKELIASSDFGSTEITVDMMIVYLCLDQKKADKAMDYLEYLWESDYEMNVSSMSTYLKLCYTVGSNEKRTKYLLNIYNKIRDKYPMMDGITADSCIMGISLTNRWKESFELMDIMKLTCKPRSISYTAIIAAAFHNNEPEIGWKFLREMISRLNPDHRVYTAYLNYCTRNFKGAELQEEISKMFEFWGNQDVHPYVDVISEYEKVLETCGWITKRTSIKELGMCRNCFHELSSLTVTPEQYTKLTNAVRERVIIGDDVYRKTTPNELKNFFSFLNRIKPYDIVIDGLNVSYTMKSKTRPDGSQLANVIKICVAMGKKVLVLGRKHMAKWTKLDIKYIKEHGDIFLAENSSADDPYLLYATLIAGPDTQFVSKDLMRQHKFLIEDTELTKIFKYWQMAHQLYPIISTYNGSLQMYLKKPPKYLPVAQKYSNGWHVPFTTDPSLQPPLIYEPPKSWVCFREKTTISTDKLK